jgi:hypothetical protein
MSKAEKFIQDYTRNCSNEIIIPTQDGNSYTKGYTHWLTPDQARRAVEIAKEEMIDKMKFYIESMVSDITFSDINGNDNFDLNKFIEDIKQAMKDG